VRKQSVLEKDLVQMLGLFVVFPAANKSNLEDGDLIKISQMMELLVCLLTIPWFS